MIDCIIICFALAIPTKDLNMDISNIKKVNLYEIPYGDKVMLLSHEEFEKYGVGRNEDITPLMDAISGKNSSKRYNSLKSAENNPEKLADVKKDMLKEQEDYIAFATLNNFNPNYFKIDKNTAMKNIERIKNMDFSKIILNKNNFLEKSNILKQDYSNSPTNRYSHYVHIGKPGEKVLEPIKSLEITPDKWMNKSRGHEGSYTKKLSAMSKGGKLNSNNQKQLLPLLK